MKYKVDDLKLRFQECSIPNHWLPPSLLPLLKILIYEYKNRLEDYNQKGNFIKNFFFKKILNIKIYFYFF